ncbi:MAG: bifunctional diaminohydroxyphosphoribosylaminopyrimidine deaminase/5-amino-6-(5-phosphoribosylamino)uracil reductase RibD [Bacteroidetes bacterium]|nr:bifunctional diaminohydroxyphosphoribosylaminopyrimidine deaminase/5-amino-6-(5-phosphoribosylamino)uracil reductase RibD [Bacteroidota bacterium]
MSTNETYMKRCLDLAVKGLGQVAPNPMVGSVIVCDGEIIGEGYHEQYGQAHAEVNAINAVKDKTLLKKSTLYVNLEPCSHFGKTPPCADLIVEHKIPYVVIGSIDTNSLVSGKGIEKLAKAGIDVKVGVLEEDCKKLNKRFFTYHEKKRPYIILKWAQTADGFIDAKRNEENTSKPIQISNSDSKKLLHLWRSQEQAIMIGTNTALLDNPQLTVREVKGKNPLRITIDKWLRIPKQFNLFDKTTPTLIFTSVDEPSQSNLEFVKINFEQAVIPQVLEELYKRNIHSLLVEGGELLLNSFIDEGLWDSARVFISEKELGKGVKAPILNQKPVVKENVSGDKLLFYVNES